MKKIILFAALMLLVFAYASCGAEDNGYVPEAAAPDTDGGVLQGEAEVPAEEAVPGVDYYDELGEFDFGGHVFNLLSRAGAFINAEELTGEVLNDAMYHRNRRIEQRFNIEFAEVLLHGADMSRARISLIAGDNAFDMMRIRCPDALAFAQQGLIHPISTVPYIDLDRPYWDSFLTDQWSIVGEIFFAAGAYDLPSYNHVDALLFNKQLAADLALDCFYALVHDGRWTFDAFESAGRAARSDLNGDGIFDQHDQHGHMQFSGFIPPNFWIAGGARSISRDGDGIPYITALDERFIRVWDRIVEIAIVSEVMYFGPNPTQMHDPLMDEIFMAGQTLFFGTPVGRLEDLRAMDIDFGILPYPKLDEHQERHYTTLGWAEWTCVPVTLHGDELIRTGVIIEALSSDSARSVIPVFYDLALVARHARDYESEAMLDIMFSYRVFDFGTTIWHDYIRGPLGGVLRAGGEGLVSTIEREAPRVQAAIDRTVNAFLGPD